MSPSSLRDVMRGAAAALVLSLIAAATAWAADGIEKIRIQISHSEVVQSAEEVRTVAIADPDVADAAVGSARTVVVTAKKEGSTNLVVYNEGGRYKVYEVEVFVPNGEKQVLLRCHVAEVTRNGLLELGLDAIVGGHTYNKNVDGIMSGSLLGSKLVSGEYSSLDPSKTLSYDPSTDIVLRYFRNDGNLGIQALIKALEEKGDVRTLANPALLAKSGEKASFLSGGEFAYQIISGSGLGAAPAIAFKEFGVRVEFTPMVLPSGEIRLKIEPEVSEPDWSRSVFGVPPLSTRKASTTVTMNSGEYLVIGGLKQSDRNKVIRRVPVLGYIPILGWLFTYSRDETTEKQLMIVVSPEIAENLTRMPVLPTDTPPDVKKR